MTAGDMSLSTCVYVEKLKRWEMELYDKMLMEEAMRPAREIDPRELLKEGLANLDYAIQVPERLETSCLSGRRYYSCCTCKWSESDYTQIWCE